MITLRPHDDIDVRCAVHDLFALGLTDATADGNQHFLAARRFFIFFLTDAPEVGIDFFLGFFADVAGV